MSDEARCRVVIGETADGELVVCGKLAWHVGRHAWRETPEALMVVMSLDALRLVDQALAERSRPTMAMVRSEAPIREAIERGEAMVAAKGGDGDG